MGLACLFRNGRIVIQMLKRIMRRNLNGREERYEKHR